MTNSNQARPVATQDLDDASLDLVVGAGVMVPDIANPDARRTQEQNDKARVGGAP